MNKSLITLSFFALNALTFACANPKESTSIEEVKDVAEKNSPGADTAHTSMNSLDWAGIYSGTVPCPSCEGVEMVLTLNGDQTYKLKTNYLGRNDALEQENSGPFTWSEEGSRVKLAGVKDGQNDYKVGENQLWLLDLDGQKVTGNLADHYLLKKK
jgi:uncharacterized lipoprotein NlpE involved in copper resistance